MRMLVKIELIREDGVVVFSELFNSRVYRFVWEAAPEEAIIDGNMKIWAVEVRVHQGEIKDDSQRASNKT